MARSLAASGRRGLAGVTPIAVLLALSVPSTAGPVQQIQQSLPPVHVQVPSVPHVNVGPPVVQNTVNPVIDHVNSTGSSAANRVNGVTGASNNGGSSNNSSG